MWNLLKSELKYVIIILIPMLYLSYVWDKLPESIPIHWNIHGEVDRMGNKSSLLGLVIGLPIFTYVLLTIIPKIDPKKKLQTMGTKYQILKFYLVLLLSAISIFVIYNALQDSMQTNILMLILGLLFTVLGNYMKTIKPNYFIGIKTPWTLESDTVWKLTHKFGGQLWFIGGLIILGISLLSPQANNFKIIMSIIGVMAVIPVLYSYLKFKEL